MDEQEKIEQQEEIIEKESEIVENFPNTESTEVQQTEGDDGEDNAGKPEEETTPEEGGEAGETVSEGDGEATKEEEEKVEETSTDNKESEELDTEKENTSSDIKEGEEKEEVTEETKDIPPSTEELLVEIENLKFEKETQEHLEGIRELNDNISKVVATQNKEMEEFNKALEGKVLDEFAKYGISPDCNPNELEPAKFQILQNIIANAKAIKDDVEAKIFKPVEEANQKLVKAKEDLVFRIASADMRKYNLSEEELKEAATTFIEIMNETGIKDLKDDIKAKVELAVARAKMIKGKVQDVSKEVTEAVKETKEDVKEVVEETKEVVKTTGKKLEDFTKGVVTNSTGGAEVTPDTVMDLYLSKKGNDRLAFLQKHKDLILEQMKNGKLNYTDNVRKW